jgi:DNA-binding NarL/FixJ family response regulator
VLVSVAPTLVEHLARFEAALGPEFEVEAGEPTDDGLAVLRAPTPPTVAFWRARYPRSWLLVVDPGRDTDATTMLNAGGDAYLAGAVSAAEVAAVLRSLARRRRAVLLPA